MSITHVCEGCFFLHTQLTQFPWVSAIYIDHCDFLIHLLLTYNGTDETRLIEKWVFCFRNVRSSSVGIFYDFLCFSNTRNNSSMYTYHQTHNKTEQTFVRTSTFLTSWVYINTSKKLPSYQTHSLACINWEFRFNPWWMYSHLHTSIHSTN